MRQKTPNAFARLLHSEERHSRSRESKRLSRNYETTPALRKPCWRVRSKQKAPPPAQTEFRITRTAAPPLAIFLPPTTRDKSSLPVRFPPQLQQPELHRLRVEQTGRNRSNKPPGLARTGDIARRSTRAHTPIPAQSPFLLFQSARPAR